MNQTLQLEGDNTEKKTSPQNQNTLWKVDCELNILRQLLISTIFANKRNTIVKHLFCSARKSIEITKHLVLDRFSFILERDRMKKKIIQQLLNFFFSHLTHSIL